MLMECAGGAARDQDRSGSGCLETRVRLRRWRGAADDRARSWLRW